MHDHSHHQHSYVVSRKLVIATAATMGFVVVELAVGLRADSLALISDAVHNFTDALALILAWFAVRLERKPATASKSYGYHRAGVLTAFINAGTLVGFTIFIFIEAFDRLRVAQPVDASSMLGVSIIALMLNTAITLWLRSEGKNDVNIRSAVIHMFGDALASAGVIVAALLIRATGSPVWDTVVSIIIGVLILWSSWGVLRETINLLLEGTPSGIDPSAVTAALGALEGVQGVHHVHIWAIGPSRAALSCHLMVGDVALKTTGKLLDRVNELLAHEYRIAHTTIQFEFANCDAADPYCVPYTADDGAGISPA